MFRIYPISCHDPVRIPSIPNGIDAMT